MELTRTIYSPNELPVAASDVNEHLGDGWSDAGRDRNYEQVVIPAAIDTAETISHATIRYSNWTYIRSDWPPDCEPIELPRPPHICLEKFHYRDNCGDWVAVADDGYRISKNDGGWRIHPCDQWPCPCSASCKPCPVEVRLIYDAGYKCIEDMPSNMRLGILHLCQYFIEGDEADKHLATMLIEQEAHLRMHGHYG